MDDVTDQPPSDAGTEHTFSLDDETPVTTTIVRAVSEVDERSREELPLLHDAVDTESLETVLESDPAAVDSAETTVFFIYAGYEVTVTADGELRLNPQ